MEQKTCNIKTCNINAYFEGTGFRVNKPDEYLTGGFYQQDKSVDLCVAFKEIKGPFDKHVMCREERQGHSNKYILYGGKLYYWDSKKKARIEIRFPLGKTAQGLMEALRWIPDSDFALQQRLSPKQLDLIKSYTGHSILGIYKEEENLKIGFDGCGISHGFLGTYFGLGVRSKAREVERIVRQAIRDGKKVHLNLVSHSRGAISANFLVKYLSDIPKELLTINMVSHDPVPGNTLFGGFIDKFLLMISLASQTTNLHRSKNLQKVHVLYPYGNPGLGHTPLLSRYPKDTHIVEEVTPGTHSLTQSISALFTPYGGFYNQRRELEPENKIAVKATYDMLTNSGKNTSNFGGTLLDHALKDMTDQSVYQEANLPRYSEASSSRLAHSNRGRVRIQKQQQAQIIIMKPPGDNEAPVVSDRYHIRVYYDKEQQPYYLWGEKSEKRVLDTDNEHVKKILQAYQTRKKNTVFTHKIFDANALKLENYKDRGDGLIALFEGNQEPTFYYFDSKAQSFVVVPKPPQEPVYLYPASSNNLPYPLRNCILYEYDNNEAKLIVYFSNGGTKNITLNQEIFNKIAQENVNRVLEPKTVKELSGEEWLYDNAVYKYERMKEVFFNSQYDGIVSNSKEVYENSLYNEFLEFVSGRNINDVCNIDDHPNMARPDWSVLADTHVSYDIRKLFVPWLKKAKNNGHAVYHEYLNEHDPNIPEKQKNNIQEDQLALRISRALVGRLFDFHHAYPVVFRTLKWLLLGGLVTGIVILTGGLGAIPLILAPLAIPVIAAGAAFIWNALIVPVRDSLLKPSILATEKDTFGDVVRNWFRASGIQYRRDFMQDKNVATGLEGMDMVDDVNPFAQVIERVDYKWARVHRTSVFTGIRDAFDVLMGNHYDFEKTGKGRKGILDILLFPVLARRLLGYAANSEHPRVTRLLLGTVGFLLEIPRVILGVALTIISAPFVALVHLFVKKISPTGRQLRNDLLNVAVKIIPEKKSGESQSSQEQEIPESTKKIQELLGDKDINTAMNAVRKTIDENNKIVYEYSEGEKKVVFQVAGGNDQQKLDALNIGGERSYGLKVF